MSSLCSMAFGPLRPSETMGAVDPGGEQLQGRVIDREGKTHCFQDRPPLPLTFSPCLLDLCTFEKHICSQRSAPHSSAQGGQCRVFCVERPGGRKAPLPLGLWESHAGEAGSILNNSDRDTVPGMDSGSSSHSRDRI